MGVGRTQINNVLKRKADILTDYDNNMGPECKRQFKDTTNKDCTYSCSLIMLPEIQYM